MQRFLFRVMYTYSDGSVSYQSVCVRAADGDESAARTEVGETLARYLTAMNCSATVTVLSVTADA